MTKDEWKRHMADLDPGLTGEFESLWAHLQATNPARDEALIDRVWTRLRRERIPFWTFLTAWRQNWTMMPARRLSMIFIGPILAFLSAHFVPPIHHDQFHLAWWGLLSPWAGLLAVPLLNRAWEASSPWADWEAMAPVDAGLRIAADWASTMVLMAMVAALGAGTDTMPWGRLHQVLLWMGPFGLTSIAAVLLIRKVGHLWSVLMISAFWGLQLLIGTAASLKSHTVWTLWFANAGSSFWPEWACLAIGLTLAALLARPGGQSWSSK